MSVTSQSLENQERSLKLANREGEAEGSKPKKRDAAEELLLLRARIDAAKTPTPHDRAPHCGDCYRRGWKAAVEAIENG